MTRGIILRHFTVQSDPGEPDGRSKERVAFCPVTGKKQFPDKASVPPQSHGIPFTPYFCGYCASWHASHLSEASVRKIRRRFGKTKLY